MAQLTVFILDYKRYFNIHNYILPNLLREPCVSQIIIAHCNYEYGPFIEPIQPNEIKITDISGKQLIRIQDAELNHTYGCFRRWIWIQRLAEKNLLLNPYILTHDDDFYFKPNELQRLFTFGLTSDAFCICGTGGRIFQDTYSPKAVHGPCSIAAGQSMLIRVSSVLEVLNLTDKYHIPPEILHEDDIVVSLLLSKGELKNFGICTEKMALPSPYARQQRASHIKNRTITARWILNLIATSL